MLGSDGPGGRRNENPIIQLKARALSGGVDARDFGGSDDATPHGRSLAPLDPRSLDDVGVWNNRNLSRLDNNRVGARRGRRVGERFGGGWNCTNRRRRLERRGL